MEASMIETTMIAALKMASNCWRKAGWENTDQIAVTANKIFDELVKEKAQ